MDHERVKELFTEYRDGELDLETNTAMGEHLAQCDNCRSRFIYYAATESLPAY